MISNYQLESLGKKILDFENTRKTPLNINLLDEMVGGLIAGQIYLVLGTSGVGKTWFCLRGIKSVLNANPEANILYSDYSGNLRNTNIKRVLMDDHLLEKIDFFQPKSLTENILLIKQLLGKQNVDYDLLILDSLLGPPLLTREILYTERKKWGSIIFSFLLDLKKITREYGIPIILTLNLIEGLTLNHVLIDPFITIKTILEKKEGRSSMQLFVFNQFADSRNIALYSDEE